MGKKCVEWQQVSRPDGKTHRRCKSFGDSENQDVLVADNGSGNMGIVVPEPISGIMDISPGDFIGPTVGALGAAVGILVSRRYGYKVSAKIPEYAGIVGGIVGAALSIPLYWVKDQKTMIQGVVSSVIVGAFHQVFPMLEAAVTSGLSGGYGLLTTQPVGALPAQVYDAASMPSAVSHQADVGAYGQVV
jgi:hypothetical protein